MSVQAEPAGSTDRQVEAQEPGDDRVPAVGPDHEPRGDPTLDSTRASAAPELYARYPTIRVPQEARYSGPLQNPDAQAAGVIYERPVEVVASDAQSSPRVARRTVGFSDEHPVGCRVVQQHGGTTSDDAHARRPIVFVGEDPLDNPEPSESVDYPGAVILPAGLLLREGAPLQEDDLVPQRGQVRGGSGTRRTTPYHHDLGPKWSLPGRSLRPVHVLTGPVRGCGIVMASR